MNGPHHISQVQPRATRISLPHRADIGIEIWMGGSDSLLGEPISLEAIDDAHIVDLAGDLPEEFRRRAGRYIPRVFMDTEARPFSYPRLASLVQELAAAARGGGPTAAPARVYILCQYGMNRSGLLTGLLLRALGEQAVESVDLIRRLRPGALSNQTFVSLIENWSEPGLS